MTTLYTIELKHPDGRPSLWAMARPQGWRPEFGGQLSAYPENAGRFDELQVSEWLAASSELLTFDIDPDVPAKLGDVASKGTVVLRWEKLRLPFTVEVKDMVGSTLTRLAAFVAASTDAVRSASTVAGRDA